MMGNRDALGSRLIRIGTRDSQLALWQARTVEEKLKGLGYAAEIIAVKSAGDVILDIPLYEFGITGIFTKTLDAAMIRGEIDIAVHSLKDVPTALPRGIVPAAVLKRADHRDILVHKGNLDFLHSAGTIATGSLRRQAQWLHQYPAHKVEDLRGNVNTRLQKLKDNENWNGAVFAKAGLERIEVLPESHILLDWMVPAPAQGAMAVAAMEKDDFCREAASKLNHFESELCTAIERQFLKTLEGGCTAPIGAFAEVIANQIRFKGVLFSVDGKEKIEIEKTIESTKYKDFGHHAALEILENGGRELMEIIKRDLKK